MNSPQVPSIGRMVHYVTRGSADGVYPPQCRAALITEVIPDGEGFKGRVNLQVFYPVGIHAELGVWYVDFPYCPLPHPGADVVDMPSALDLDDRGLLGTWHWPSHV